ncbi:MAG: hypothetical protein ACM3PY_18500 [Omnitrophica WOR_2 bacterium]
MLQNKRVLLCGHSLFFSSVQACMEAEPGLVMQQVDPQPDHIRECVIDWHPDVLILETGQLQSAFSVSLLHDFPHMKLIGLDIEDNRLLVFTGSSSSMATSKDLLGWIDS